MSTKEQLIKARKLIDTPDKWIKGRFNGDRNDCFCAMGALRHIDANDHAYLALQRNLPKALRPVPERMSMCIAVFNDRSSTTHADILHLFDRAIAEVNDEEI